MLLDREMLSQLLQTPWTSKAILTCELSNPQEEACQQLAGLSSASIAVMSQVLHHLTHSPRHSDMQLKLGVSTSSTSTSTSTSTSSLPEQNT